MHTESVSEDGKVYVDFNRAFNPLPAFTAYTTCTFAAKENALSCTIEAGERYVGPHPDGH